MKIKTIEIKAILELLRHWKKENLVIENFTDKDKNGLIKRLEDLLAKRMEWLESLEK